LNTGQFRLGTCRRADRSLVLVATAGEAASHSRSVTARTNHHAVTKPVCQAAWANHHRYFRLR
jgi:hypothetical protein